MVVDAISQPVRITPELIQAWSDRYSGVGFSRLLVVEPPSSPDVDFRYHLYNADGSEAKLYGSGARCFARFVREHRLTNKRVIRVETACSVLELRVERDGWVAVNMGVPELISAADGSERAVLSTVLLGNTHGVTLVDNVDTIPVTTPGELSTKPPGLPVNAKMCFMQIVDRNNIRLRTIEYDSGEALVCDSGACAAVVAGSLRGLLDKRVRVSLSGGQLVVEWQGQGTPVMMAGPTANVFEGQVRVTGRPKNRSRF